MSLPNLRLLSGLLASLLVGSTAQAQIHEEKPLPGLEEGVLLHIAETPEVSNKNSPQQLAYSGATDIAAGDFSICFWADVSNMKALSGALSKSSDDVGWAVNVGPQIGRSAHQVEVRLQHPSLAGAITIRAPIRDESNGGEHHVAIIIKRDARQPLSGVWIDGVERVSVAVPPVSLSCPDSPLTFQNTHPWFRFHDLRIYNRALTRTEILELTLRRQGTASDKPKPKHPTPPPNGPRFIPQPDETIALIGGTEAVALAESGELEALLLMAFPQTKFHFRCLAWEGDTVFRQDRPMNFGSLEQQLRRVNAGAVFVMFGRQECLDAAQATTRSGVFATADQKPPRSGKNEASGSAAGAEGVSTAVKNTPLLGEFKTAFGKLLDTVAKVTPNIVVIGPVPFERKVPPLPDLSGRNSELRAYSDAMSDAANQRSATYADLLGMLSQPIAMDTQTDTGWTTDGVMLNADGSSLMARIVRIDVFEVEGRRGMDLITSLQPALKVLRTKSRLWHDYWRPSNWAFLHGDRTNQPSSRDPVNPQVRLFPAEQEKYLPLIKEAEDKIFQLVQEAQKKLP